MSNQRWTKQRPTAAQKRAAARERAFAQCEQGYHASTPTFRPGETVCLTCGIVFYCPECLKANTLPAPQTHAYPVLCPTHTKERLHA